jgi:hypothetical protein
VRPQEYLQRHQRARRGVSELLLGVLHRWALPTRREQRVGIEMPDGVGAVLGDRPLPPGAAVVRLVFGEQPVDAPKGVAKIREGRPATEAVATPPAVVASAIAAVVPVTIITSFADVAVITGGAAMPPPGEIGSERKPAAAMGCFRVPT